MQDNQSSTSSEFDDESPYRNYMQRRARSFDSNEPTPLQAAHQFLHSQGVPIPDNTLATHWDNNREDYNLEEAQDDAYFRHLQEREMRYHQERMNMMNQA